MAYNNVVRKFRIFQFSRKFKYFFAPNSAQSEVEMRRSGEQLAQALISLKQKQLR